ncbi:hypothetical protein BLNAU_4263 [Blattamonas nauphoetae]|uniref:Uncharacterized protein n=1 Tax=Blattamonas nauphoetae TaxID=2049346 RepID=A0ABQ9YAR0_9EUKA|nr:hypothetical protein BLNAU_4263 [Blattamonas nauphoetae]
MTDSSAFLNWTEEKPESEDEPAVVFMSLVATLKLQPAPDVSLEAKAVRFIKSVSQTTRSSAKAFLNSFGRITDESMTDFVQSMVVLLSTPSQVITAATMKMLDDLVLWGSSNNLLLLVKADLIPQIVVTLNLQSLSFAETEDIHINVMRIIRNSLWLATWDGLTELEIEAHDEQQAVNETVFKQVLSPSEKYICHLCVNRFSIIDGDQSERFLRLLTHLLQISPYHQPTMDIIHHMPVILTISSCLTFFDKDFTIWTFLYRMNSAQREWNDKRGEVRQMGMKVHRMLRMEGIEDVMEERLRNDQDEEGDSIVVESIMLHNQPGMNISQLWIGRCCHPIHGRSQSLLIRRPHTPTPLFFSLTTHTLPLPSASPSPPTPSHSHLPLPHHPHPPTPLCLSHHNPHPPTPLCLSLTTLTLPLPSASSFTRLGVALSPPFIIPFLPLVIHFHIQSMHTIILNTQHGTVYRSSACQTATSIASVLLLADDGWAESVGGPNTKAPSFPLDEHDENHVFCGTSQRHRINRNA